MCSAGDELGRTTAGIGDVNGDGVPDLAVGVPRRDTAGGADAGSVLLISGSEKTENTA